MHPHMTAIFEKSQEFSVANVVIDDFHKKKGMTLRNWWPNATIFMTCNYTSLMINWSRKHTKV